MDRMEKYLSRSELAAKLPRTKKRMTQAPLNFDGNLDAFFEDCIQPNLPHPDSVFHYHKLLKDYCLNPDPLFLIRKVSQTDPGNSYVTDHANRFRATDNSPAWWMHYVVFNDLLVCRSDFAEAIENIPVRMFDVGKRLPTSINAAGSYVAHIFRVKDGVTNFRSWSRDELVKRFLGNIHPCNCFYVPQKVGRQYGEDPHVIAYIASQYEKRYHDVWREFVALVDGPSLSSPDDAGKLPILIGNHGEKPLQHPTDTNNQPSVSYRASRFTFISKHIETLTSDQAFRMITNDGTFQMTKADFYRDFAAVTQTDSYRLQGRYNREKPPKAALVYQVFDATESKTA